MSKEDDQKDEVRMEGATSIRAASSLQVVRRHWRVLGNETVQMLLWSIAKGKLSMAIIQNGNSKCTKFYLLNDPQKSYWDFSDFAILTGPRMCAPSTRSVDFCPRIFTMPSVSAFVLALLLAAKGNLPTLYSIPCGEQTSWFPLVKSSLLLLKNQRSKYLLMILTKEQIHKL